MISADGKNNDDQELYCEDGWTYSIEHTQIRLCGGACDAYRDVQEANVAFFCPQG